MNPRAARLERGSRCNPARCHHRSPGSGRIEDTAAQAKAGPLRKARKDRVRGAGLGRGRARIAAAGSNRRDARANCQPEKVSLVDSPQERPNTAGLAAPPRCARRSAGATRFFARLMRICDGHTRPDPARRSAHRLDARGGARRLRVAVQRPAVPRAARAPRKFRRRTGSRSARCCRSRPGACPEDCKYCPQSVRYDTGLGREELMEVAEVVAAAETAKAQGATRFCMGAAYRNPKPKQLEQIKQMVRRSPRARSRNLRDARHADAAAGRRAEGRGPRLLQPQPRHVAGVLRRDHHDAHLPGPARYAAGRARCGPQRLLRRHPRHGRVRNRSHRPAAHARHAAAAPGERADQPARAGPRHAAVRHTRTRPARFRARDRDGPPADAALVRAAVRRAAPT